MGKENLQSSSWKDLHHAISSKRMIGKRELANLVKQYVGVDLDYAIWRLLKEGILQRPIEKKRGLFLVVNNQLSGNHIIDNFSAIQNIYSKEIVFCYGTALLLHGLSRYGMLTHYFIVSKDKSGQKILGQNTIRLVRTKLGDKQGIILRKDEKRSIYVTDLERTLVECIHRPKYAQGWENIIHALDSVKQIEVKTIFEYIKKMNLPSLTAKAGYILEQYKDKLNIPEEELIKLQQYIPRIPARFERSLKGALNKRWNIFIPEYLFKK